MIFCFDLDGTLVTDEAGNYAACEPLTDRIDHVNLLYKQGHTILIVTARNAAWQHLTQTQVQQFGIQHHSLIVGQKVFAHRYIDDRAIHADAFFG